MIQSRSVKKSSSKENNRMGKLLRKILRKLFFYFIKPHIAFQQFIKKFEIGSFSFRLQFDAVEYPSYAFGVYNAVQNAHLLDVPKISIIEFGVAGGNGLIALEKIAEEAEKDFGVQIEIFGFDLCSGLPEPEDYKDVPYLWKAGHFKMNETKLRERLSRSTLILGDVSDTINDFLIRKDLAPIGFISFDLDFYSSTKKAFKIFSGVHKNYLPRVMIHLDDIIGTHIAYFNEYQGQLLAVKEYNIENKMKKICPINCLKYKRYFEAAWNEKIYVCHDFEHSLYNKYILGIDERTDGDLKD